MTRLNRVELDDQLRALNQKVRDAVSARKAWMDSHMEDYAKFKIGDTLVDLSNGEVLGIVTELYRFWGDKQDSTLDDSMEINYEYQEPSGTYDNTSSQPGLKFGTSEDHARVAERRFRKARKAA